MRTFLIGLLMVVLGVIGPALSEALILTLLSVIPSEWDLTGSYFLLMVPAGVLIVVLATALVTTPLLRKHPLLTALAYGIPFLLVYVAMLVNFNNPAMDVLKYVAVIIVAIGFAFWWRTRSRTEAA